MSSEIWASGLSTKVGFRQNQRPGVGKVGALRLEPGLEGKGGLER